jgi:dTDP-4-amino-4,6-dideoxygalactose transaminase
VTTGEGGAVTTDKGELAEAVRSLRHHGWTSDERMPAPGLNYRLPDVLCAIGIPQVRRLDELLTARAALAAGYGERLAGAVETPRAADGDVHGWQAYVVQVDRRTGSRRTATRAPSPVPTAVSSGRWRSRSTRASPRATSTGSPRR